MIKHRLQVKRRIQAIVMLCLAVVVMSVGASLCGAEQVKKSPAADLKAPKTFKQKPATAVAAKSSKTPATRKETATDSESSHAPVAKRDPFKLPEIPTGKSGPVMDSAGGVLPPGVRGLLISQLRLVGVIRELAANKMLAVVTNDTRRAYFLTENESVYNGVVSKITPDAVYFAENVLDVHGRVTTHEVVKRLGSAPGEGR